MGKPRQMQGQVKREAPVKLTPLGDDRFQELMQGMSAAFAKAERDVDAKKAQTIKEIRALMAHHGLTVDDLAD